MNAVAQHIFPLWSQNLRNSRWNELRPPQDDLGLWGGDPPERLVIEKENEVTRSKTPVGGDGAQGVEVANKGAAEVEGQRL